MKKRLADMKSKKWTFRNWVTQHNQKLKWNFDDPRELKNQLVRTIKESGDIDIRTVFEIMFALEESGLTFDQTSLFQKENY